jgi:GDPmannose 4,6-dehydratase
VSESMKKALITGITGQDGSYLAELLLSKGYIVHGIKRRSSSFNTDRVDPLYETGKWKDRLFVHYGDVADAGCLSRLITEIRPDEVYNLAAQSHVKVSFEIPEHTADIAGMGTLRLLDAVLNAKLDCRVYQASSSEMFGSTLPPQSEISPFHPRSPYGCAKVFAHMLAVNYRESYGMHISCGILFNHESPRRGGTFVTRKITRAVARIKHGLESKLYLGNLDARRDWGYAPDYVEAMWMMLQQEKPDDYVIGTGESHSVREFVEAAFNHVGLDWQKYVVIDERYMRPAEVEFLQADCSKVKRTLRWKPTVGFDGLVKTMVEADLKEVEIKLGGGEAAVSATSQH